MSRVPLVLILALTALESGMAVRGSGTPAAHSQALSAAPRALPQARAAAVQVQVVVQPNPASVGDSLTLTAVTSPGAVCSAGATLATGVADPQPALLDQPTADTNGRATWNWTASVEEAFGANTVRVSCTTFTDSGSGLGTFTVLNPAGATPIPTVTIVSGNTSVVINGPSPIQPGGIFSVSGAGFPPGSTVSFAVFTSGLSYTAPVAPNGTFTISQVTVPYTQPAGRVAIFVRDSANAGADTRVELTVGQVAPRLQVSPGNGAPGDPIAFSGSGFGANEVVTLSLGPLQLATARTDNLGALQGTITVPGGVQFGTYNLSANGERTGGLALAQIAIVPDSNQGPTAVPTDSPTPSPTPAPPTATPTSTPGATVVNYYLAEGTTANGAQERLQVLNPDDDQAYASLMLTFRDGNVVYATPIVPAHSVGTINVNALVPAGEQGRDVAIQVSADQHVSVARRLDRPGRANTVTLGASQPSHYSYFAEGYTGNGFKESLALFNAVNQNTQVELDLLPSNGGDPIVQSFSIGPMRRYTVDVNALVKGGAYGAQIISDAEIAVERTLTFGKNAHGQTIVAAAPTPQPTWYFAEGSTGNGFSEYLTLLNPGDTPANVSARFYDAQGGQLGIRNQILQGHARATINVGSVVHASSVGAIVSSSAPILAERSMYRGNLAGAAAVGSGTFGRASPAPAFDFPSGDTSAGQSEYLLLLNPNPVPLLVRATFFTATGVRVPYQVRVPARARVTINVGRDVAALPPGPHGVRLSTDTTSGFVAEQSLYGPGFSSASTNGGAEALLPPVQP